MNLLKPDRNTFFCFSPPIMVATCVIELTLLIYNVIRYKFTKLTFLVASLLLLLALFQLSEFRVCRGSAAIIQWSHIGYIAITLLPTIGIHVISTIRGKKHNPLVYFGYLTSTAFVAYFALTADSLAGHACLGTYVIFQVNTSLTWLYALYYYGWVIIGLVSSYSYAQKSKIKKHKIALYAFSIGYASFLIPTTTANLLDKSTLRGIPSIMCGFAVLLAIIITLWVMPTVGEKRD